MKYTAERKKKRKQDKIIRILFVIDSLTGGGAEKVLQTLVNHMDPDRFDITVLTFEDTDPEPYLKKGIHYRSIYRSRSRAGRAFFHALFRILAEAGIAHSLFVRDTYDMEVAYLEYGPTKFVSQSPDPDSIKLAWVHCDLSMNHSDQKSIRRQKEAYRKFDRIACVSSVAEKGFFKQFGTDFPVSIIPNVIDEEEIIRRAMEPSAENRAGGSSEEIRLIAVGRLIPVKGFDRLIHCCALLDKEGIAFRLDILGEGEERPALEKQIRAEGLEGQVHLRGFIGNPYPYMKQADVLVCSSHYEGSSTVIREAMILGKAVVTTDCGDMRDVIGDSEYGILTQDTLESFYNGIHRMVMSRELRSHYEDMAARRGEKLKKDYAVRENEAFFLHAIQEKKNEEQ